MACSNCLIIDGASVLLPDAVRAAGGAATNYRDDGEPHFAAWRRTQPLDLFVLHETAGDTAGGCEATLLRSASKLGVHLILDHDGHLSCHADLGGEIVRHAGPVNARSVGVEVVNPYNPVFDWEPYEATQAARWWTWVPSAASAASVRATLARRGWAAVPKLYCQPTAAQVAVLKALAPWLCGVLGVPWAFPTAALGPRRGGGSGALTVEARRLGPGVVAHRDFSGHSDGRWPLAQLDPAVVV